MDYSWHLNTIHIWCFCFYNMYVAVVFDAVLQVNKFDDNGIYLQCESVFHSSKEDWENDRKNPEEVISIVTGLKLSIMMSA